MTRNELEKSWAITRVHLADAERVLTVVAPESIRWPEYRSYLDHNELGLAFEELFLIASELEDAGQAVPDEAMRALNAAAANMKSIARRRD